MQLEQCVKQLTSECLPSGSRELRSCTEPCQGTRWGGGSREEHLTSWSRQGTHCPRQCPSLYAFVLLATQLFQLCLPNASKCEGCRVAIDHFPELGEGFSIADADLRGCGYWISEEFPICRMPLHARNKRFCFYMGYYHVSRWLQNSKKKALARWVFAAVVKVSLGPPTSPIRVLGSKSQLHSQFQLPANTHPGRRHPNFVGLCHSYGRSRRSSRLLALT